MTQWVHNLKPGIESQAPQIIPVCVSLTVIAVIATALRCHVRVNMLKIFGADDWVILASTVCPIHLAYIFLFFSFARSS
ncbi:hypothetical protein L873DRAFT_68144 [Choiromyces venosus 120613-1]|uniref:Uncharacterized protein n=1 Tax=Choiromyces venosus 120613-1 TaxID=1336337 RepID=A0A3N4J549_9PEZI|nr:hypothetical protein L873DRAFT_68144 [Choiromyces venosus 120613-1]